MFRVLPLFAVLADGQQYGNGWGKTTYSVSDGTGCYTWMNEYLPIEEDHPNGPFGQCGDVGRARLLTSSYTSGEQPGPPGHGFGLHTVHVVESSGSARLHAACTSPKDIEQQLDATFEKAYKGEYDAFLDFNGGHWVSSLDPYVSKFTASSQPFMKLSWQDEVNGKGYYSVLVRVHTSMMIIELMSAECSSCDDAVSAPAPRYVFAQGQSPEDIWTLNDKTAAKPIMHPARISWPSTSVSRERQFFADGMGALLTSLENGEVKTDVYDFTNIMSSTSGMQFHIVERPASANSLSWADFEEEMMSCHSSTIQDDVCGENVWMDNHAGLAISGSNKKKLDAGILSDLASDLGLPFHATSSPRGTPVAYAIAGNGLSIAMQVEAGSWVAPRDMETGMLDLCGDGTCPSTFVA